MFLLFVFLLKMTGAIVTLHYEYEITPPWGGVTVFYSDNIRPGADKFLFILYVEA